MQWVWLIRNPFPAVGAGKFSHTVGSSFMCTPACLDFVRNALRDDEVNARSVLEVGSFDVNGSVRPIVAALNPASYIGVDLVEGAGVDFVCDAARLVARFGSEAFDVVISTELLEHVRDWRAVVSQLKHVLKPGGVLLLTTRSEGFPYHAFPWDFWRYEVDDMRAIFSDFEIERVEPDPGSPGVLFKGRKPAQFHETDLDGHPLFSIIKQERIHQISQDELVRFYRRRARRRFLQTPERMIRRLRARIRRTGN